MISLTAASLVQGKDEKGQQMLFLPVSRIHESIELLWSGCDLTDGSLNHGEFAGSTFRMAQEPVSKLGHVNRTDAPSDPAGPMVPPSRAFLWWEVLDEEIIPSKPGCHYSRSSLSLAIVPDGGR